jgi:hypothetical protein
MTAVAHHEPSVGSTEDPVGLLATPVPGFSNNFLDAVALLAVQDGGFFRIDVLVKYGQGVVPGKTGSVCLY